MFDPLDFLVLARQLGTGSEARVRTAVSRAYYACFLLARAKLGLPLLLPQVHQKVIKGLYHQKRISTANRLSRLRQLRNQSDYDLGATLRAVEAQKALERADSIISDLRRWRA